MEMFAEKVLASILRLQGKSMTEGYSCALSTKLQIKIVETRCGKPSKGELFLEDNAPAC
jgi:hypothetical protein